MCGSTFRLGSDSEVQFYILTTVTSTYAYLNDFLAHVFGGGGGANFQIICRDVAHGPAALHLYLGDLRVGASLCTSTSPPRAARKDL